MLKLKTMGLISIFASLVTMTPKAMAGENGIAGSASFIMLGNAVQEASTAIAIGKTTAYGAATTEGTKTQAFAVGTGGEITFATSSIYINTIAEESPAGLVIEAANQLDAQTVEINGVSGVITGSN